MTVCIVDTSILCELFDLPRKADRHDEIVAGFDDRQKGREHFLLPINVIVETAKHIAQVEQGGVRRDRAERFVTFVRLALDGESPFVPTPFPTAKQVGEWLDGFIDDATKEISMADRSLIAIWDEQRALHTSRRVYIWSLDKHLSSYDSGSHSFQRRTVP